MGYRIFGLTGPTGAGKSTISLALRDMGFFVIDCDKTAKRATEKGSSLLDILSQNFGKEVLNPDLSLNRKVLARIAFKSPEDTEKLNKIMLPFIIDLVKDEIKKAANSGEKNIVLDAPTLFESGADSLCDKTVGVICDQKIRLGRIVKRDSISENDALLRISAGKSDEFFTQRCDHIIYNDGDREKFIESAVNLFKSMEYNQ